MQCLAFLYNSITRSCHPMKHEAFSPVTFKHKVTMYFEKLILFPVLKANFQKFGCVIQTQKDQY